VERQANYTPTAFALYQNYPNPFNAETVISFALPTSVRVSLKIFNLKGEKVATVWDDYLSAGYREVKFEAKGLTSGVYFYQLEAGEYSSIKKFVLVK
jgi:hypothetical protein